MLTVTFLSCSSRSMSGPSFGLEASRVSAAIAAGSLASMNMPLRSLWLMGSPATYA
jgi:hypothetical protein